jgi:N-methylhydantoinase A
MILGVDTGGTFTDFVFFDGASIRIHKVLSTPKAPEQAIIQGIHELDLFTACQRGELSIIHGSTVATNAALENKGVRTVYITNRGFKDILSIGRQTRRELYNLQPESITPPVPNELCLETGGRLGADGSIIDDLTEQDLKQLRQQLQILKPEAVAINCLFSFLDPRFEKMIEAVITELPETIFCSRSSFVLPEYKEYERGMATWLNAWLGPIIQNYLDKLQKALAPTPIAVMQSSGGTIEASQAAQRTVNLLLSGPAGGLAAAKFISQHINTEQLMTFDMGGTSTDVALIDGKIQLSNEGHIGHYPVAVPMVDMHTIGAGGGSIASIDVGGLLQVGPQSAGADPGPACYGAGGTLPTVTDANAVLGRLRPDAFLGGKMTLEVEAAKTAVNTIAIPLQLSTEQAALGILALANEHMTRALRVISVQKGYDPGNFTLCCFGGAGGLHVCALADSLNMQQAIVPVHGGVLSALGMLVAPRERQLSRTLQSLLDEIDEITIETVLEQLRSDGHEQLTAGGIEPSLIQEQASLDLRYQGQSYTLNIPWQSIAETSEHFHRAHQQRYGHQFKLPLELVNIRLALKAQIQTLKLPSSTINTAAAPWSTATMPGVGTGVPIYHRHQLMAKQIIKGPALVTETIATTLVAKDWTARQDEYGNLLLNKL